MATLKEYQDKTKGPFDGKLSMNLDDVAFDIDGIDIKFKVEGSVVTVWAYRETEISYDIVTHEDVHPVDRIREMPAWVEIAQFDPRDYV